MSILIKSDVEFLIKLIDKYTTLYVQRDFIGIDIASEIELDEIKRGLSVANILSASNLETNKSIALKYSTIIAIIVEDSIILQRCNNILSQLTIFTFSDVLQKRKGYKENLFKTNGIALFEKLYREEYFSKLFINKKVKLNRFQLSVIEAITDYNNISVSAPTSIGKSFLMKKIILDTVLKKEGKVIYIVPTRALINEVMNDIQEELSTLKLEESIFVTCSPEINDSIIENKCIFILTQERLNQLCSNIGYKIAVDLIVVDEAQQISQGSRGLLLEYTIRRTKQLWPNIKIFFISPLIDNPNIFLERLSLESAYCKNENLSSVNQNIICLQKRSRKSIIDIKYNNAIIGEFAFPSIRQSNIENKIAYIYNNFNNGENSIIYCNIQSSTRKIANEIIKDERFCDLDDIDLVEFSDFLKKYICEQYDLAKLITKGVAYHYSKMPSIIKMGIEDLAKKGKLKVITCTATLLEGINIQANNIYIYNPRKKNDWLTNLEFWNLSGRAGRMKNDICGNIICIDIKNDWYEEKYSKKNIENIEFEKHKIFSNDFELFEEYLHNRDIGLSEYQIKSFETLESILLVEKIEEQEFLAQYDKLDIKEINKLLEDKLENNEVPETLLKKLVGINIESINRLWKGFENNYQYIDELFLLNPFSDASEDRLYEVLGIINTVFFNEKYPEEFVQAVKITMLKWIKEKSLKEILFYDLNLSNSTSKEINKKIESRLGFLNDTIRYEFSRYLYAYQEVLREFLISKGNIEIIEKMCNYPLYIEFGASDKKTLELMYLGIFREGAILLSKIIKSEEPDEIYYELKALNLNELNINGYIKNKILEKINVI